MVRASGDVLLRVEADRGTGLAAAAATMSLGAAGTTFALEPLFEVPASPARGAAGLAPSRRAVWHRARATGVAVGSAWDATRELARQASLAGAAVTHAEPDLIQEWPTEHAGAEGIAAAGADFQDESEDGGKFAFPQPRVFAWHLGDDFTGLASAREAARAGGNDTLIRIAHLDVGYALDHDVFPQEGFEPILAKNCTGDGRPDRDVRDLVPDGLNKNPGHGMGTVGMLAGGRFRLSDDVCEKCNYEPFDGVLGAAAGARIVGVRVGESVVQIRTSSVAQAIAYAAELCNNEETRVHVLSMSMGGVASQAWADAVNLAYSRGVVMVTAAGNNFSNGLGGGAPTTSTVYPARFERVLSACGVMGNFKPYFGLHLGTMQGCYGPKFKRATSLAAFTPNTSWARKSDQHVVDMNGAGTSSATPQIAGAAALYLQKHADDLFSADKYPEPWMRVEAVRQALLRSAKKDFPGGDVEKFGTGVLRARAALDLAPIPREQLRLAPLADASFAFLHALFGIGLAANNGEPDRLLQLEMAQLVQQWQPTKAEEANPFDALLDRADEEGTLSEADQRGLAERLLAHPRASVALQSALANVLGKGADGAGAPRNMGPRDGAEPVAQPAPLRRPPSKFEPEVPKVRELRGYALDPSFALTLSTRTVSETAYRIAWDETLGPGPADEYVEVIDVDPASRFVYEPVDLRDPHLLAARGLAPSVGTPQFHQQMVYAVSRMTIDNFEHALGRPALWRPGPPPAGSSEKDDSVYVQRLRIYPHALRAANAYYSPGKIALLFGYFTSRAAPGSPPQQVFTCLSQDIVAHETTHALLDGMHRKYLSDSNPDVLAFHEAFADIVALLQRLALPELLRHEIARTRGEIRTQRSLLGQLATEFGRATGERGGLREAIGGFDQKTGEWIATVPTGLEYGASTEPHTRGSVLVAAVFDALISIYERRSEDLVRIATEGTGVLRPGALHPDLVARLADEATKSASHVLQMCIRALDYCPPTDLTFGEYLRALITADYELVPDDDLGYRVAFVEAFRKRGITVEAVRTLSTESLLWRREEEEPQRLSTELCEALWKFRDAANAHAFSKDRRKIFYWQRAVRRDVHGWLVDHFAKSPVGPADAAALGIDPTKPFEVHTARFAMRVGPDGQLLSQAIVGLLQEDKTRLVGGKPFEGGSTVIADLATRRIRFIIRKSTTNKDRYERQQDYALAAARDGGASSYFRPSDFDEPFAALHAKGGF